MTTLEGFALTRRGRIHHLQQGHGDPLVLLHSNGCSLHEFVPAMAHLGEHFRCVAWDMPGHGDSDPPAGHQAVEDYADAVLALMDALGIERAHIAGASIGGLICIALGTIAPARCLSTVIVEAALRTEPEWAAQWPRVEAMFATPQQTQDEVSPRMRQLTPALLTRWNIDRQKAGAWRMVDVMWAIREYDAITELARARCPSAVLVGDKGPVIAQRARYETAQPGAPIAVMAGAGHFPMLDDPAEFAAVTRGLIRAARPPASRARGAS